MTRVAPTMGTAVAGNYETAAFWNANVLALGLFLLSPPSFFGYQTHSASPQSILNNTFTAVLLDTEVYDPDGGHSTVTNTSRFTCQVAGRYQFDGTVAFASNATGFRAAKFQVNGATPSPVGSERAAAATSSFATVSVSTELQLAVGDYVELMAFQNSGGSLNLDSNTANEYVSHMRCRWVSI